MARYVVSAFPLAFPLAPRIALSLIPGVNWHHTLLVSLYFTTGNDTMLVEIDTIFHLGIQSLYWYRVVAKVSVTTGGGGRNNRSSLAHLRCHRYGNLVDTQWAAYRSYCTCARPAGACWVASCPLSWKRVPGGFRCPQSEWLRAESEVYSKYGKLHKEQKEYNRQHMLICNLRAVTITGVI